MTIPSPIITTLGLSAALLILYRLASVAWVYTRPSQISRYLHPSADGANKPAWALITGASDGIGKEFASQLAARGFNVVLHGRNKAKLEGVRAALAAAYPDRQFRVFVADASLAADPKAIRFDTLAEGKELGDLHLTVLINNAGGGVDRFEPLHAYDRKTIADQIALNALFPAYLTQALLPKLIAAAPALIINIGSLADQGLPLLASYAGSKSFLLTMTRSVAREMKLLGHDVEAVMMRSGTVTGTSGVKTPERFGNPRPPTFVMAALNRVGCGQSVVIPYFPHALQIWASSLVPWFLRDTLLITLMSHVKKTGLGAVKKE